MHINDKNTYKKQTNKQKPKTQPKVIELITLDKLFE